MTSMDLPHSQSTTTLFLKHATDLVPPSQSATDVGRASFTEVPNEASPGSDVITVSPLCGDALTQIWLFFSGHEHISCHCKEQ